MIKILFVCHGNICRSPMAEFVMKDIVRKNHLAKDFHIESRATTEDEICNGEGSPIYEPALSELKKHKIFNEESKDDILSKRAILLTEDDFYNFNYIIGMDQENLRYINRIKPEDSKAEVHLLRDFTEEKGYVSDPWYTRDFEKAYNDIYNGCKGFFSFLEWFLLRCSGIT